MNANPYANNNALAQPSGRHIRALLSFPLIVLTTYLWPTPATFARHKDHAVWSILVLLLCCLTLIAGMCAYVWGRLPSLSRGIQALSLQRLSPQPLSPASAVLLALGAPLLILGWAFALHILAHMQQGRGSYRAQLYSVLVIETPLVLMLVATVLLLSVAPAMGAVVRVPFATIALLLLLYSFILLLPSLMGVQQLSAGQAALCLVAILTIALILFFFSDMFDSNTTSHGSGGGHFKKPRNRHERLCPQCGFSLEVYDQLHQALTQSCPKCGKPLF